MPSQNELRECWAEIEKISSKTLKSYKSWYFLGYYPISGKFLKSTKNFDYYQTPDGRYKYRKKES